MPGQYIYPLTSYFTGGTVSGETVFLAGVTANTLSTENFLISGITLDQAIQQLIDYSAFSGGTISGDTYFASGLSAGTFSVEGNITPFNDNISNLGIPTNRWSELHIVDGAAVNFTASTQILLGNKILNQENIILSGDTLIGGTW